MRRVVMLLVLMLLAPAAGADVALDRTTLSVGPGEGFTFTSTVSGASPGDVVHLNIAALDPDVHVDPEDWSEERTRYVTSVGSVRHDWELQAVGSGEFVVYVSVASPGAPGRVVASAPLRLSVAQRQTLGATNALPVVLTVPGVVLVLVGWTARRRRRLR